MIGIGYGSVEENFYDAAKLRWLCTISKILNCLDEYKDEDFKMKVREEVALQLRKPTEQTPTVLTGIYDQLKPEKSDEEKAAEKAEKEAAAAKEQPTVRLTALQILGLLVDELKASGLRAGECEDVGALHMAQLGLADLRAEMTRAENGLLMLTEIIAAKLSEVPADTAPVELEVAA
jgi:hypothetical protein